MKDNKHFIVLRIRDDNIKWEGVKCKSNYNHGHCRRKYGLAMEFGSIILQCKFNMVVRVSTHPILELVGNQHPSKYDVGNHASKHGFSMGLGCVFCQSKRNFKSRAR